MKLFTKLLIAVSLCVSFAMAGEVVVANGGPASISKDDLKNIFHGKKKKWPDGTNVTLVLLKGGADHESFMQNVVGKTPSQFLTFWKKEVFTGKGVMPKEFDNDAAALQFIASTKGAVGYVSAGSAGSLPAGVKKITVN